ncbi:MAG: DUF374 domain-containing protein [Proteobacteria bacterium]|nr:DUF374 domain-containing protein [Pseudomonadota bacterium]
MLRALAALFGVVVIRLLRATWRVRLSGPAPPYRDGPVVFCFWHGRQAGLFAHPRPRPVAVLASRSRDGALQARILARLGFDVHRGSSSRGGASGLMSLVRAVRGGADAAFAVDGPRGPVRRAKPGAVLAARAAGAAIVPITVRASRQWVFTEAWDGYALPKPFAAVEIVRGGALPAVSATATEIGAALDALER